MGWREPTLFNEALRREGATVPKIMQQFARFLSPSTPHKHIHRQTSVCVYEETAVDKASDL